MKDSREEWYDPEKKVRFVAVDVRSAAQELARSHLSGPVAAKFLSQALAAAALLGSEMSEEEETISVQMKCSGPLGGFNVECSSAGTLRGYTERKVLDGFDGNGDFDPKQVVGRCQYQVIRSCPGRILSSGISNSLDGYLAGSLQRKAVIHLEAEVNNDVEILCARGVIVEELPDGKNTGVLAVEIGSLSRPVRLILDDFGLSQAVLKKTMPLSFACRCSPERAARMLAALDGGERADLPDKIDVTCHMCGRTFTVKRAE